MGTRRDPDDSKWVADRPLEAQNDFILNFYKTDREIELKVKVNLLRKINEDKKKIHGDKKLKVSDETLVELNSIVKAELESITYENMSNYSGILNLIFSFDLFNASIDTLSKDIEENIFKSPDDFFKILDIFQSHRIVNGSYKEHYISKESLEKLIKLEVVEKYIGKLDSIISKRDIVFLISDNNSEFIFSY